MAIERSVPRGKALDWSEEEWDRAAEISPQDVEEAAAEFRKHAPADRAELLDAEVETAEGDT